MTETATGTFLFKETNLTLFIWWERRADDRVPLALGWFVLLALAQ